MICKKPNRINRKSFNTVYLINLGILILIIPLIISACGLKQQKPAPDSENDKAQEEQPDITPLKALEENIEKIFMELGGPTVLEDTKQQPQDQSKQKQEKDQGDKQGQKQSEQQGDQDEKSGQGQQGQQDKQGQEGQQQGQPSPGPQPTPDPWSTVVQMVTELHSKLNDYMPTAIRLGASRTTVDNISSAVNNLTNHVEARDSLNAMLAANDLYGYIPELYTMYKTNVPPELKKMRYYAREALLCSKAGDWDRASQYSDNLKSGWQMLRSSLKPNQLETGNKLEYSIQELDKVIKERNIILTEIKGKITMKSLAAMEKAFEEESK